MLSVATVSFNHCSLHRNLTLVLVSHVYATYENKESGRFWGFLSPQEGIESEVPHFCPVPPAPPAGIRAPETRGFRPRAQAISSCASRPETHLFFQRGVGT